MTAEKETRINEWFVPRFGPIRFRVFVGLLFLPYTGMCVSFAVTGSLLASSISWERLGAIALIYALALGIGAHAADGLGSRARKPWGAHFSKRQLAMLAAISLSVAYAIGIYYIISYAPLLATIAILEGFFLVAYNLELFGGRLHNDLWFSVSWGSLPVLAGYVIQTNNFDVLSLLVAAMAGVVSFFEIRLSRPYKELKRLGIYNARVDMLEGRLKLLSLSTISFGIVFLIIRIVFS